MFEQDSSGRHLRKTEQADLLASGIRVALSAFGPVGAVVSEFLTQVVPAQRFDRLQDFTERLAARLDGQEQAFKEFLSSSPAFSALAEETTQVAVRVASDECRKDLAALLVHGLSRSDAEIIEVQALLRLRERISDAQVLILVSYGNFKRTMGDADLKTFYDAHPGLFSARPPSTSSSPDERRRWTMFQHYQAELESFGLLSDTEGVARSSRGKNYQITHLGRLLLETIGQYRDPRQ